MGYSSYWHAELEDSPSEDGSNESGGSFNATVKLQCYWQDRIAILNEIVGNFQLYPRYPGSGARAVSGSSVPFKGAIGSEFLDLGFAAYQYAQLTIKYQLKAETSDLISESLEPTAEFMTLDYRKFRWKTSQLPLTEQEAPGRLIKGLEYGITFYMVQSLPSWLIDPNTGLMETVNTAAVQSKLLGLTFQPGTLLFNPPKATRKWNFTKFPYWQVDLKLSHKKNGWNKFWCGATQSYDTMQTYGAGGTAANPNWVDYNNFSTGDFSQIWTMGAGIVDRPPARQGAGGNPPANAGAGGAIGGNGQISAFDTVEDTGD